MECLYCGSLNYRKNGTARGLQRYRCKDCHHYFSEKPRKFSYKDKRRALDMYLNNVGIRKIAYFLGASPTLILRWIRNFGEELSKKLAKTSETIKDNLPDIIEMDEIYTFIQKNSKEPQYGLLIAGKQRRIIAHVIGKGIDAAKDLYHKVKEKCGSIKQICTDANSCYDVAFKSLGIPEAHIITKAETHLIESSNSRIRDNLARFNRRTKRYSKSLDMLQHTLNLFFHNSH